MDKRIVSLVMVSVMIFSLGVLGVGVLAYPSRIETEWTGPNSHTTGCHGGGSWVNAANGTVTVKAMLNGEAVDSVQINTKFNVIISIANFTDVVNIPGRDGKVGIAATYKRGDNDAFFISPTSTFEVELDAWGSLDEFNMTFYSPSEGGMYTIIVDIFNGRNYTTGSHIEFIYFENSLTLAITPLPPNNINIMGYVILGTSLIGAGVAVGVIVLILRRRSGPSKSII